MGIGLRYQGLVPALHVRQFQACRTRFLVRVWLGVVLVRRVRKTSTVSLIVVLSPLVRCTFHTLGERWLQRISNLYPNGIIVSLMKSSDWLSLGGIFLITRNQCFPDNLAAKTSRDLAMPVMLHIICSVPHLSESGT